MRFIEDRRTARAVGVNLLHVVGTDVVLLDQAEHRFYRRGERSRRRVVLGHDAAQQFELREGTIGSDAVGQTLGVRFFRDDAQPRIDRTRAGRAAGGHVRCEHARCACMSTEQPFDRAGLIGASRCRGRKRECKRDRVLHVRCIDAEQMRRAHRGADSAEQADRRPAFVKGRRMHGPSETNFDLVTGHQRRQYRPAAKAVAFRYRESGRDDLAAGMNGAAWSCIGKFETEDISGMREAGEVRGCFFCRRQQGSLTLSALRSNVSADVARDSVVVAGDEARERVEQPLLRALKRFPRQMLEAQVRGSAAEAFERIG